MHIELQIAGVVASAARFPGGTIFFVELQLVLKEENQGESRTESAGGSDFPGPFNDAVTVKEAQYDPDADGCGYYSCHRYQLNVQLSSAQPKSECAYCHNGKCRKERPGEALLSDVKQLKPSTTVIGSPG